jgi:outer membrane protein assembly factor BamB
VSGSGRRWQRGTCARHNAATLMRLRIAVLLCVVASCGSRTGLQASTPSHEAGAALQDGAVAVRGTCVAALLAGAPTPMDGYCPTRGHLAPGLLPTAPQIAWQSPLPSLFGQPMELVVDSAGRIYATLDTDDAAGTDTIAAFDANGSQAWSDKFDGQGSGALQGPRSLFLSTDGTLHFIGSGPGPTLVVLDRDGTLGPTYPLPASLARELAVGRDGSLYVQLWVGQTSTQIAKLTALGQVMWTSPTLPTTCSFGTSEIALTQEDHPVVAFATTRSGAGCMQAAQLITRVATLDDGGAVAWQRDFPGLWGPDPAIALDGTIRLALTGTDTTQPMHLLELDASGNTIWDTDLGADSANVGSSPPAIAMDGAAVVQTSEGLVAISASGQILWRRPASNAFQSDVAVDPDGTLAFLDQELSGIDVATGTPRWSLQGAVVAFAVGTSGSVVGILGLDQGQFALFLAR